MSRGILVDTGPLVAIFSREDEHHEACVEVLRGLTPPLLTCWPVITEAAWLLRRRPKEIRRLLHSIQAALFQLLELDESALEPIARFLQKYEDRHAQLADACLLYLAEREQIRTIFTLDRRDFSIYRLSGNRSLQLLPE